MMMRYLLVFLFLGVSFSVSAQVGEPRRDVAIGINAGVTINSVSFQPSVDQSMKISPSFGMTIKYTCEKYFKAYCALQGEINYYNLGWKQKFDPVSYPDYRYNRDVHMITVPIMARMGWGREKNRGCMGYIVAGPQIGFILGESETMSNQLKLAVEKNEQLSASRRSQYGKALEKTFMYGITAGAGLEVHAGRVGHFMIEARYYLGLGDMFKNGKSEYFGRSANNTISVKVHWIYDVLKTKKVIYTD